MFDRFQPLGAANSRKYSLESRYPPHASSRSPPSQFAPRVSPQPGAPKQIPRPATREGAVAAERCFQSGAGPNVVSEYFINKNCRERARNFWKKPWGRYKVDLPLPSYLKDFKYADNQLLRPHFAHYRRNVGVGREAEQSLM